MNRVSSTITRTFSALTIRNYRLWVVGQGISLSGTWMQTVAQGLLVLQLTGSGTALGLVTALQTFPVLLFGPWGGVVADRFPKRRILYVTQAVSAVLVFCWERWWQPGRSASRWSTWLRSVWERSARWTTRRANPS